MSKRPITVMVSEHISDEQAQAALDGIIADIVADTFACGYQQGEEDAHREYPCAKSAEKRERRCLDRAMAKLSALSNGAKPIEPVVQCPASCMELVTCVPAILCPKCGRMTTVVQYEHPRHGPSHMLAEHPAPTEPPADPPQSDEWVCDCGEPGVGSVGGRVLCNEHAPEHMRVDAIPEDPYKSDETDADEGERAAGWWWLCSGEVWTIGEVLDDFGLALRSEPPERRLRWDGKGYDPKDPRITWGPHLGDHPPGWTYTEGPKGEYRWRALPTTPHPGPLEVTEEHARAASDARDAWAGRPSAWDRLEWQARDGWRAVARGVLSVGATTAGTRRTPLADGGDHEVGRDTEIDG